MLLWKNTLSLKHHLLEQQQLQPHRLLARFFSTSSKEQQLPGGAKKSVYVHPLSQIVLLHFQSSCHEWICQKGLDRNLRLHRDGTFVLENNRTRQRIWTYYDGMDKKHWLAFSSGPVHFKFLLQDNLMPAWNGNKRQSLPERVQSSVNDLMLAVDELE